MTATDLNILYLLGEGLSHPEIAAKLSVNVWNIKHRITSILRITGARGREQLGIWQHCELFHIGLAELEMHPERCAMCKEAGFPDVPAHYKAIPAGRSHDGKVHPPMCYDHKNGKVPRFIERRPRVDSVPAEEDLVDVDIDDSEDIVVATLPKPVPNWEVFEPDEVDIPRALSLRAEGKTWKQVSEIMGVAMHRVYAACRDKDTAPPKAPPKWEECFREIKDINIGESITVNLPVGGTRAQMNSVIGMNKLTQKWHWSLTDNQDGTVTATKLRPWETLEEVVAKNAIEPDEPEITEPEPKIEIAAPIVVAELPPPDSDAAIAAEEKAYADFIAVRRKVTLIIPDAQPTTQVKITPAIAQAVWSSLDLEGKARLMGIESMWEDWDDWLRMETVSKVLLISDDDIEAAKLPK